MNFGMQVPKTLRYLPGCFSDDANVPDNSVLLQLGTQEISSTLRCVGLNLSNGIQDVQEVHTVVFILLLRIGVASAWMRFFR